VQRAFFVGDQLASVGDHAIDFRVIMIGVVMEQKESFHVRFEREFDDVVDAAVTPATVLAVFLAVILSIHDEDIDAFDELCNFTVFIAGVFQFGGVTAAAELGIVAMAEMRFVVGEKGDRAVAGGKSIADADARMIGHAGFDVDCAEVEACFFEFFDVDVGGDFFQSDGEKGTFHLAGKNVCQAVPCAFVTENAETILFFIDREKKREALNVIPMRVRQEQGDFHWRIIELGHQLATERAQAGASVENDDLALGADFDAGSVAAVADSGWAGSWNRAADAPKFQVHCLFPGRFMSDFLLSFGSSGARHDVSFRRA